MNSLEKLIQMATIEQMYSMLQKMKSNTETMVESPVHEASSDRIRNLEKSFNELRNNFDELDKEFDENSVIVSKQSNLIGQLMSHVDKLTQRIEQMEKKFEWEQSNPPMSNPPMSNPPMSNPVEPVTCDNIVLTVEEHSEPTMEMPVVPDLSIIETKECVDDNQWMPDDNKELTEADYLALVEHATASIAYEKVRVKNEVEAECGEMESDTLPDKEVQVKNEVADEAEEVHEVVEEYSEPEVETEDEDEPQVNEVIEKEEVEKKDEVEEGEVVEKESVEEEDEVEEEEEVVEEAVVEENESEEEVFEIEIDEVTYYATSEDNGILYEMLEGGDIGKQVGTIQDGEPIFN
jgi:hypothetical protein